MKGSIFLTTPIYYVNGAPHLGHMYTSVSVDFLNRFYRNRGYDTFFLTGTDEHGQKVFQSAEKNNISPQEFCNNVSQTFKNLAHKITVEYDDFIRTTESRHKTYVQSIWKKLEDNGWIYQDIYSGWYSISDEAFYDESEIVNGLAPSGSAVVWRDEESYFFKLSNFSEALLKWYDASPHFVFPFGRYNEVKSFVKSGLKDLSISRSAMSWGIDIPNTNHVIYVWLDALFNYQSALDKIEKFKTFWNGDKIVHVIGKDILRFHAVYWPAFLTGLECNVDNLSVEKIDKACKNMQIVSHGWWLVDGLKMSKSLGNVVEPFELIDKYGSDYVRYFLLKEANFGGDGNFTEENFITRITSDLINNIGNLCQRTFTMIHKNCNGIIPHCKTSHILLDYDIYAEMELLLNEYKINQALDLIIQYSSRANEFIQEAKPWELFKNGKQQEGEEVLYILLFVIYQIKEVMAAALPDFYSRISDVFDNKPFASGVKLNHITKVFQPCNT